MFKVAFPAFVAAFTLLLLPLPSAYCQRQGAPDHSQESAEVGARHVFFRPARPTAQVMADLNKLVQAGPSWEAFYRRAFLRYISNQYAGAAADCEQSLKLQKCQAVYYLLAASSLSQGPRSWPKVLAAAAGMAAANPEAAHSYEYAAFIAALQGDFDSALDQLAADAAQTVLAGKDRYDKRTIGQIGSLGNDDLETITSALGVSDKQKRQKQLVLALAAFFKTDYGRSAALTGDLGQAGGGPKQGHNSAGDLALALRICNDQMLAQPAGVEEKALQLVRQTGESKASLSLLDTTYFVLGERDKSLAFLDHLIERERAKTVHPKSGDKIIDLLYARARLHEQMSATRPALSDCQAILKLDPDQRKARLEACRYQLMLGEKQGVLADLDKYLNKYPGDGAAKFLRAQIFALDKNWQPATRDLSQAIADGYYLIKALRARAACYRAMHQSSLADNDMALAEKFRVDNFVVRDMVAHAHPRFSQAAP